MSRPSFLLLLLDLRLLTRNVHALPHLTQELCHIAEWDVDQVLDLVVSVAFDLANADRVQVWSREESSADASVVDFSYRAVHLGVFSHCLLPV